MSLTVLQTLHTVVREHEDAVAIIEEKDGDITNYTYRWLWSAALTYSAAINKKEIVGLDIERGAHFIAAVVGCWMSRGAYVPFDRQAPSDRIKSQLSQAGCRKLIKKMIPTMQPTSDIPSVVDDLAYIVFTSGSTGNPKGVLVSHAGLLTVIQSQIKKFKLSSSSKYYWGYSQAFDASLSDIFCALLCGASLLIDFKMSSRSIPSYCNNFMLTAMDVPPSLLPVMDPGLFDRNITFVVGGEVCSNEAIQQYLTHGHKLISVYGPTEATICTSMATCTSEWKTGDIGKPIDGVVYVIDKDTSELIIFSKAVASGYLNNSNLTDKKFCRVPARLLSENYLQLSSTELLPCRMVNETEECVVGFRTGDIVTEGIYKGRIDRQIKHMGHLIAPEEIEQTITRIGCQRAAVFVSQDFGLVAACQTDESKKVFIKENLNKKLPKYLNPDVIFCCRTLPVNSSGKIDYATLSEKISEKQQTKSTKDIESTLRYCWASVLCLQESEIRNSDLFYKLGGSSFTSLKLLSLCRKNGIELTLDLILENYSFSLTVDILTILNSLKDIWIQLLHIETDSNNTYLDKSFTYLGGTSFEILRFVGLCNKININTPILTGEESLLELCKRIAISRVVATACGVSIIDIESNDSLNGSTKKKLSLALQDCGIAITQKDFHNNNPIHNIISNCRQRTTTTPTVTSLSDLYQKVNHLVAKFTTEECIKIPKINSLKKRILLTGGSGYLGSKIAYKILSEYGNDIKELRCLTRNNDKLHRAINRWSSSDVSISDKVVVVEGSICRLDDDELYDNITDVIHCAADTSIIKSYEDLEEVNVNSVDWILQQQRRVGFDIHHASSLAMFVSMSCCPGEITDQLTSPEDSDKNFIEGGYAQTKFVSDQLIVKSSNTVGCRNIFRFGLLLGIDKHINSSSLLKLYLKCIKAAGCVPSHIDSTKLKFDVTCVDWSITTMLTEIFQNKFNKTSVFHLSSQSGCSLSDIVTLLNCLTVPVDDFSRIVSEGGHLLASQIIESVTSRMARSSPLNLFQMTGISFQSKKNNSCPCPKKILQNFLLCDD